MLGVKNLPANVRHKRLELNPWVGKIPWRGHGNPLQYSCLENPYGQRSLADYSPGGGKESDTTEWLSTTALLSEGFPGGTSSKNSPASSGDIRDAGLIPGSGRSLGRGHGNPFLYYCLENPMDRGVWQAIVHRVTESLTKLNRLSTAQHTYTVINWPHDL